MQYRPEHTDLIDAIQEFLIKEVLPAVKDNDAVAYKTFVSWNMLGVVSRELKNGRTLLEQDVAALAQMLGEKIHPHELADRALWQEAQKLAIAAARAIRQSKASDDSAEWQTVKEMLKHNLQIANPRYGVE